MLKKIMRWMNIKNNRQKAQRKRKKKNGIQK